MTATMYHGAATTSGATGAIPYSNTNEASSSSSSSPCWGETALDWWQRSRQYQQRQAKLLEQAKTPSAAAHAFVLQPLTARLPFLVSQEPQIQQQQSSSSSLTGRRNNGPSKRRRRNGFLTPLVECSGLIGKTTTLLTLATQYVVQTRPSRFSSFRNNNNNNNNNNGKNRCANTGGDDGVATVLPQVFILDSTWEISAPQIQRMVRSFLLRDYDTMATATGGTTASTNDEEGTAKSTTTTEGDESTTVPLHADDRHTNTNDDTDVVERLAADCRSCTERIHVACADENTSAGWLPILESLSEHLSGTSRYHPTLVLWDGLGELQRDAHGTELQRTILRLVREFRVMVVYTTTHPLSRTKYREWDDRLTHRIRLERAPTAAGDGATATTPDFVAHYCSF